jgi:hypothetical protein
MCKVHPRVGPLPNRALGGGGGGGGGGVEEEEGSLIPISARCTAAA